MAETVIGKDTVAWLKIDVFDLTGNQLQEGPEEGWQVLFGHNDIFPKLEQALMGKKARRYRYADPGAGRCFRRKRTGTDSLRSAEFARRQC